MKYTRSKKSGLLMPFLDRIFDYKIVICMAKTLKHLLDLLEPTYPTDELITSALFSIILTL